MIIKLKLLFFKIFIKKSLIRKIEEVATKSINYKLKDKSANFNTIKTQIVTDLFPFIYELTGNLL